MKRLLAMFMVLLFPFCAGAETYQVSVGFEVNENLLNRVFNEATLHDQDAASGNELETLVQLIQRILDNSGMVVTIQDDAAAINVNIGGASLMDMTIYTTPDASYLTSSMIPGCALVIETKEQEAEVQAAINGIEWIDVSSALEASVSNWLVGIESTTAYGMFIGDAFDGGTQCTTWVLSDRDIAGFVSAVLSDEVRRVISLYLTSMGFDSTDVLREFDNLNARVADDNEFIYIFRIVKNEREDVVGMSLTVLQDETQVATVSLGFQGNEVHIVTGLGMNENNYWWEFTCGLGDVQGTTCAGGLTREWVSEKELGFAYISAHETPVTDYKWYCNVRKVGNRYLWDAAVYEEQSNMSYDYLFTSTGSFTPANVTLDASMILGGGLEPLITMNVDCFPAAPIPAMESELMLYSLTDPVMAQESEKIMQQLTTAITARLIKLLPMDLIFQLSMPLIP